MCFCCRKSKWKNEREQRVIQSHKFDFVDIDEFYENSFVRKFRYSLVFIVVLKSILVYLLDLQNAGILLIFDKWGSSVDPKIPIKFSKWIFVGCIMMSFVILAWDIKKARPIIASRDISVTFTSLIATRYYTLRSYSHYCFFSQIQESKKLVDSIAFFCYFSFKGWKRLIFAELPRQVVNAVTIYSYIERNHAKNYLEFNKFGGSIIQRLVIASMAFTLVVFILSFSMLCLAFILYIPLLCHIRGNLKEYCCHKVDKRISELIKMKSKKRIERNKLEAEALAKGNISHLKNKKDAGAILPKEPTLPVFIDDEPQLPTYGIPPPYNSRPGSPNHSRPGTPGYPSRTGTPPVYRAPSRPGTPGYGQVKPNGSMRRNSVSSITSGMTNVSANSYGSGSGGYYPPNRSQTPPINQPKPNRDNFVSRAVINYNTERGYDDDLHSEYGGSQSSLGDDASSKPSLNRYNSHELYRAPPPTRSYSPTPSVSSTTSNPRSRPPNGTHPLRYQQDHRSYRYNNYSQQGGGPNRN